ncbi:hypothetical protein RRF57_006343 [Xylaria bambusicola]|uniref:Uncharacterized protein n=1 Tax=Xylaria bambusicola TaxID=326684 RepID=A0AAN7UJ54_9PEZI
MDVTPTRLMTEQRHTKDPKTQSPTQASITLATRRENSLQGILTLTETTLIKTVPIERPPIRIPYPTLRTLIHTLFSTLSFPPGPARTKPQNQQVETRDSTQRSTRNHDSAAPGGWTTGGLDRSSQRQR